MGGMVASPNNAAAESVTAVGSRRTVTPVESGIDARDRTCLPSRPMRSFRPGIHDQSGFDVRFDWGLRGLEAAGVGADVVLVVDVLSFSSAVDVAVGRGAIVYPFARRDASAQAFAEAHGALVAGSRDSVSPTHPLSLSPTSLRKVPPGCTLVLPSPNGSMLSVVAMGMGPAVVAGCLRNATAVARAARAHGRTILVLAAGERWPDGSLRPALEDLLGAGAILSALRGSFSPEAAVAAASFSAENVRSLIEASASGHELIARGFGEDVELSTAHDESEVVPILVDGAYRAASTGK
jgi:2-phosphosulfolactate phosphatase